MPLVYRKDEKKLKISIWESTEGLNEFTTANSVDPELRQLLENAKSLNRQRELLTVRKLLKEMLPAGTDVQLKYDEFGKPALEGPFAVSISHTGPYVAVMLSKTPGAGLDLELIRPQISRLSVKFINDTERAYLPDNPDPDTLHTLWGAKEVLYKLYGRKQLDFRKHLNILPFHYENSGKLTGEINMEHFKKQYLIHYEKWNSCLLAYSTD